MEILLEIGFFLLRLAAHGLTQLLPLSTRSNSWKFIIESNPFAAPSLPSALSLNTCSSNANMIETKPSDEFIRTAEGTQKIVFKILTITQLAAHTLFEIDFHVHWTVQQVFVAFRTSGPRRWKTVYNLFK